MAVDKCTCKHAGSLLLEIEKGSSTMWYAVQVYTGQEEKMLKLCETYVALNFSVQFFCPKYEASYKKKGIRTVVKRILFPGYLFLDTEQIEEIYLQLKKFPEFTKILKMGEDYIPLTEEEKNFIKKHGNADYIFEMSRGYIEGDEIIITEGAFAGYEGRLKYVDRHNRYGVIEVEMFGRITEMKFGLEIVRRV